jgi:hypothetical protein
MDPEHQLLFDRLAPVSAGTGPKPMSHHVVSTRMAAAVEREWVGVAIADHTFGGLTFGGLTFGGLTFGGRDPA